MKRSTSRVLLAFFAITLTQASWAAPKTVSGRPVVYLGSALDNVFSGSTSVPALSALFTLGDTAALQAYLGIHGINSFQMGGGVNFKHSLIGDNLKGFHIGGGVALGANGGVARTFFVNVAPNMGLHFELVDRVLVSFDMSLCFSIRTAGASNLELTLGGNSNLLGASVLFGL